MTPQFVDFNADGHIDIVAGIFDGSPHVAFGDGSHFGKPEQILDKAGARIVMNQFWNFDTKKWDTTDRCNPEGSELPEGQLTSTWAFDWDQDGDLDLLLGDYKGGHVMLRRNEGTNASSAFATHNEIVEAAGKPLNIGGKVATIRMVDWTGDGHQDLLVGSVGDAYGSGPGGGIVVYPNAGGGKTPTFGEPITLVEVSKKDAKGLQRPDSGLYMDAVDFEGDGDLDLVVGGYSTFTPEPDKNAKKPGPSHEELRGLVAHISKLQHDFFEKVQQDAGDMSTEEGQKKFEKLFEERSKSDEYKAILAKLKRAQGMLEYYEPKPKRASYVWLYENLAIKAKLERGQ